MLSAPVNDTANEMTQSNASPVQSGAHQEQPHLVERSSLMGRRTHDFPLRERDRRRGIFATAQSIYGNQALLRMLNRATPAPVLQRKCACDGSETACGSCDEKQPTVLHRKAAHHSEPKGIPPIVHEVLRSPGQPLDAGTRGFMEPRFGHNFSGVRIHTDARANESARAVNAIAYTVGHHIVFGAGQHVPQSVPGRELMAHELAHTIQQRGYVGQSDSLVIGDPDTASEREAELAAKHIETDHAQVVAFEPSKIARVPCTSAATCSRGRAVTGSARHFLEQVLAREESARSRRQRMTPARALAHDHGGRARQLEIFLEAQQPGRLALIQGIFIDQDLDSHVGGMIQNCAAWMARALPAGSAPPPGMEGATRPCIFVAPRRNQEALAFNTTTNPIIGGRRRERWRLAALQTLTHETEHARFANVNLPRPAGVTSGTCTRAGIDQELSELAAVLSEFPALFDRLNAEADPHGPVHRYANRWWREAVHAGSENIEAALRQMGCSCSCSEVDAFVIDAFNEVTAAGTWSVAARNAFNTRMRVELPARRRPSWPL